MTTAYDADSWVSFAVAVTAAAATLAGLLFVAVSINLQRILEYANLPARAAKTLILFTTPLITGLFLVAPRQPRAVLAWELLITAIAIGALQIVIDVRTERSEQETLLIWIVGWVLPGIVSCGCLATVGGTMLAQAGGGLYWLIPTVVVAVIFGLVNAWVLLVEILR